MFYEKFNNYKQQIILNILSLQLDYISFIDKYYFIKQLISDIYYFKTPNKNMIIKQKLTID